MDGLNIPSEVLGTWLQDATGKAFLLVVDVNGEWIKNGEDSRMFHSLVSSLFKFPVVTTWREKDGWHIGGEKPWKTIAEHTDPTSFRLHKIPISFSETEKKLRKLEENGS